MEANRSRSNTVGISSYELTLFENRLKWFLVLRLVIAIFALVAILIYQKTLQDFPPRLSAAYVTLIFTCFVNILYFISIRWTLINPKKLAFIQISIDIVLETLLVYFTSGIRGSIFIYLYFASIVASALLTSARSSFFFASLASTFLSAITITYFLAAHFNSPLPFLPVDYVLSITSELRFILPYLFFFALALHLVAFLSGQLNIELSHERILKDEILQGMSSGLIVVDRNSKIVFCNNQAKELLHLPKGEILNNKRVDKVLTNPQFALLQEALVDNRSFKDEIVFSARDGGGSPSGGQKKDKEVFIEFITSALKGTRNEVRGTIALLNDITLSKELSEVTKRAERWQSLSEMGTAIAHEIRNPLASIKSAAQELNVINRLLTPNEQKLFQIIIKESARLNQIITDFLDFTRERPISLQECNIADVLDEVCILMEQKDRSRPITIQKEYKGNLRSKVDHEQLKQVFLNLGINALESDTTKIIIRASLSKRTEENNGITIDFIDFGKGIEPNNLDKIFDPFFTDKPKGVGMGLAIARKIIQLHKGRISVESAPGKGSIFSVWLPVGQIK